MGLFDECGHVLVPTNADGKGIKDELSRVVEYISSLKYFTFNVPHENAYGAASMQL